MPRWFWASTSMSLDSHGCSDIVQYLNCFILWVLLCKYLIIFPGQVNPVPCQSEERDVTCGWRPMCGCWPGGTSHHPAVWLYRMSSVALWGLVRVWIISLLHPPLWWASGPSVYSLCALAIAITCECLLILSPPNCTTSAYQRREVVCKLHNGTIVSNLQCDNRTRPRHRQECYNYQCSGVWRVGDWSEVRILRAFSVLIWGCKVRIL